MSVGNYPGDMAVAIATEENKIFERKRGTIYA